MVTYKITKQNARYQRLTLNKIYTSRTNQANHQQKCYGTESKNLATHPRPFFRIKLWGN